MDNKQVMEIAIRKVKSGKDEVFLNARGKFIDKLKSQEGIQKDWEFKSFFTMPELDDTDVFVGMTRYDSTDSMQKIANNLMSSQEALTFFDTFEMKSFVAVQPANENEVKLEDYIKNGNVLEVAVRTVKESNKSEFESKRKEFFNLIEKQEGYLFDKEFIDILTGDKVVLIGWKSIEDFQKAATFLQNQPQMGQFFNILNVKAYQALALSSN